MFHYVLCDENIMYLIRKKLDDFLKVIGGSLITAPIKLKDRFSFEFAESRVLLPIPAFSEHPV